MVTSEDRVSTEDLSGTEGEVFRYLGRLFRQPDRQVRQMISDRDHVHREYGRLFHPTNLSRLTADDFKRFLLYDNNRHWWGIHRHQRRLVSDMARLRGGLMVLLDESMPIVQRLDLIEPSGGPKPVPGLGKAVFTPILHVVYPDRYGVWNSIAESAMTRLELWPSFERGSTFGEKYIAVNDVLQSTASKLNVDLWTVDSLWWRVEQEHEPTRHQFDGTSSTGSSTGYSSSPSARARSTFVCEQCFQTKSNHLRSSVEDVCIDCQPDGD